MQPKPGGLGSEYAAQFDDESIVAAYGARPPYPESLVTLILDVAGVARPRLLDLGCGTGELTRRLALHVDAIVAVDRSPRMIDAAKRMPGGDAAAIAWIVGEAETAPLTGPFDLALAAQSFHWFDWPRACARIVDLVPTRRLALVEGRYEVESPWGDALRGLFAQYSTNRAFEPYDLVDELVSRGLFTTTDRARLGPERFTQSVDDYVQSMHSQNGFSLDRMTPESSRAFDAAVRALVMPHARPLLDLQIETRVTWGRVDGTQNLELRTQK